ncbi:hypothetical protein TWF694_004621 [Orbilia ellipsospora]|uniref:Uncharacterized protein n=1 Tax=Orbilia ellipsospora TaxID=2528407 RepID=A0AAV9WVP8_9PEZI
MQSRMGRETGYQSSKPQRKRLAEFESELQSRPRPKTPPPKLQKHPLFQDPTTPPKHMTTAPPHAYVEDTDDVSFMQPITPPPRARPDFFNANQLSPASLQTLRTQFTSKSTVPSRWLPEYPPASTKTSRSKLEFKGQRERDAKAVIEKGIDLSSSDDDNDDDDGGLLNIRRDITSLSDNYSEYRFNDDENVGNSPPDFARYIRVPAPAQEPQEIYDEHGKKIQPSPGTLSRQLRDAKDIILAEGELKKLKLESSCEAVVKPVARQIFPTFPKKFEAVGEIPKPFIPDGHIVASMTEIPDLLANYKPHYIHGLFGNYIVSCDDIDELYIPMRVGQLSIFIPIEMKSEDIIIVGLAPCELFHSNWMGTGSPAPAPDRSIIGKRAYEVQVTLPLQRDYTIDRRKVTPTGNTLGTVIGVAGAACVLRIEKWFLRSYLFATESRIIPVWGGMIPKNPKLVFYDNPKVYNEHRREMERKAKNRREMEHKISVTTLGGTPDRDPRQKGQPAGNWTVLNYPKHGVIAPPKYLSPVKLGGITEPRVEPVRVPWGKMHGMTERDQRKEKINEKMEEIANMIKTLQK